MAERKNPYHYDPDYYVHGSTVRKLNAPQGQTAGGTRKKKGYASAQPATRERERALPKRKPATREPVRKKIPQREPDRYERLVRQQEQKIIFHQPRHRVFRYNNAVQCHVFSGIPLCALP